VPKADRVTAVLLLVSAVAFSAGALKYYPYWGEGGPGSAFLPFWLGVVMAALAVLLLLRKPVGEALDWLPHGEGRKRVLIVIGATAAFIAALKIIGMVLGTTLYLIVLMRFLGRHPWPLSLAVAAAAAGINYLVFAYWLRVPFPEGMFWIF
jgi:putative tricarboxylic transport membrane protein